MSSNTQQSEADRRREAKHIYGRVLSIVEKQTGGELAPMVSRSTVRQIVGHSNMDLEAGDRALRAAEQNGDDLAFHGQVAVADEESLRAVLSWEAEKESRAEH